LSTPRRPRLVESIMAPPAYGGLRFAVAARDFGLSPMVQLRSQL
jgi:hypothetical protein